MCCSLHCISPRTVSFSIWGSSAVLIRRRRCRNSTYANWYWYWQWNAIAMKEVGEYFGCMKQPFRRNYWHMVEPHFHPFVACCGRGSFPVSNLYRRSGRLSRVGCSLLLSSPAPSLFHRCSLSFAVVIQFGDPSPIVLALVCYGVALCCVIASRTKRKIGQ
jgi:hypothetical protein